MRARSSATAACARSSRSSSARAARSFATSVSSNLRPSMNPTTHTATKKSSAKKKSPAPLV